MSSRLGGGGMESSFLSAHRCPEVDLLTQRGAETQIPPPCSSFPADVHSELTCKGQSATEYLDVSSSRCSVEKENEREDEEGSNSDWSEEDLSLHFSPSVILPSEDEQSDPESGFACVDINTETQLRGQQREWLKMVPKREIQLKKRDKEEIEKRQVILKDGTAERGGADSDVSANELNRSTVGHRPDVLLRQHSVPASFHCHSLTSSDFDSNKVYKGLVAGSSYGFHFGGNSATRRLQKSISLDETKTRMASCIIKSVLSKKMQVEQNVSSENNNCTTCTTKASHVQPQINEKLLVLPTPTLPVGQERVTEGRGKTSCPVGKATGLFKNPVHVVRDMRSLVKNTYRLPFRNNSKAPTTKPETFNKPTIFRVIGQEDSPPPSYQQAVGATGHQEAKKAPVNSSNPRGYVTNVPVSLCQSQDTKDSNRFSHPIRQDRRGSKPILRRKKVDDKTHPAMLLDLHTKSGEFSQTERDIDVSHLTGSSYNQSPTLSTSNLTKGTQQPLSDRAQSAILHMSSKSVPVSIQPMINSCFSTPSSLRVLPTTLHPHLGNVCYVQSPVSYMQTQLHVQSIPPHCPTFHLHHRTQSEENQSMLTVNTSCQPDGFKSLTRKSISNAEQDSNSNSVTSTRYQRQLLCNVQGFLPTQTGSSFLMDVGAPVPFSGAACHMMLDPNNGRCFYVETPPQPQRKMLLDPETGKYIEVIVPAASSAPSTSVFAVCGANPTPTMLNPTPAFLSVMQFQQPLAVSSLYPPPCLPFTLRTSAVDYTHTAP